MKNEQNNQTENGGQSSVLVVRCADCIWWDVDWNCDVDNNGEDIYEQGECRRYPPILNIALISGSVIHINITTPGLWIKPLTFPEDSCGEYQERT